MSYNPYDLVELTVNGIPIHGRPYEFDSELVDHDAGTNKDGGLVKPTKLSTCCPECGDGIWLDVLYDDPPFPVVEISCPHCGTAEQPGDPFREPVSAGAVTEEQLDPANETLEVPPQDDGLTVAERTTIYAQDPDLTEMLSESAEESEPTEDIDEDVDEVAPLLELPAEQDDEGEPELGGLAIDELIDDEDE